MSGNCYTIGITDASKIINDRLRANNFTPFVSDDFAKRVDPKKVFPDARSLVVVCVPYGVDMFCSNLSSLGVCEDYHVRVKDVLRTEASKLHQLHGSFKNKILVDSPALCERSLAVRAGLGFFGRHGLVISPEFGSRVNIGVMLTDIPLYELNLSFRGLQRRHIPFYDSCPDDCKLCIKACPNGAINEGRSLAANLCISYLTQKEKLTAEEEKLFHGQLYGCDICQNVCPKNVKHMTSYVDPKKILMLSDSEVTEQFGHTAMNWRLRLLKRNALIVKGRREKQEDTCVY